MLHAPCVRCLWAFSWGRGRSVVLHAILALSVAWLWATSSLPVCLLPAERCGCWPMPTAMTRTWLWACPALTHTQEHEHVHNPTAIILPCLLSLLPNAHVRRYIRWMPTGWDENGKRPQPGPSLFCSIRRCFHWFYLV